MTDSTTPRWTLHEGDCLDVLRALPDASVDAVVTDPPYDKKTHVGARRQARHGRGADAIAIDFAPLTNFEFVYELLRVSRGWVLCFCTLEQLAGYEQAAGESWIRAGVWHRTNSAPQFSGDRPAQGADGVAIMHRPGRKRWNGGGHKAHWSCPVEHRGRVHPTQKPIALMRTLVGLFTQPDALVLDPFAGSGTTGVAALELGRRFVGAERDPAYAAIARNRLAAAAPALPLPTAV